MRSHRLGPICFALNPRNFSSFPVLKIDAPNDFACEVIRIGPICFALNPRNFSSFPALKIDAPNDFACEVILVSGSGHLCAAER
jgi:hypothetical protein